MAARLGHSLIISVSFFCVYIHIRNWLDLFRFGIRICTVLQAWSAWPLCHCAMALAPLPLRRIQAPLSKKKLNVLRALAPGPPPGKSCKMFCA